MITTAPASDPEDLKFVLANLFSNIFGNQLIIGDIHAPMNQISDIFKIVRGDQDIIGGWTLFYGFDRPTVAFPVDPTGWDAIKGFLSMTQHDELIVPFPTEFENDHGKRPWDDWNHYQLEYLHTDIAMRITTKDIEVRDISDLPKIRAATEEDTKRLQRFYQDIDKSEFQGFFHPLQLESDNYVVCEDVGEIVATAGTHFETVHTVQLGNIYVKKAYRDRGIGRAVTTAVTLGAIKTKRVPTLFVNEKNAKAIALYEDIGFERYNAYDFYVAKRR